MRVPFRHDSSAAAVVRAELSAWLDRAEAVADDMVLATSELVTNVVVHTNGGGECRLWRDGNRVRVEVRDFDRRAPKVAESVSAEGGYGLRIVDTMSVGWGWEPMHDGKVVWAQFDVDHSTAPAVGDAFADDRHLQCR